MHHSPPRLTRSLKALPILAATLCLLSSPDKALALSTVDDIASGQMVPTVEQPIVGPSKEIPPSHWSYHLVQKLAEQAHLQEKDIPLDGSRPINRTEMAVLLADLSTKTPMLEGQLSEKEQTQFEILREEFQSEVKVLEARITNVENAVQTLNAKVDNTLLKDAGSKPAIAAADKPTMEIFGFAQGVMTLDSNTAPTEHNFRIRSTYMGIRGQIAKNWKYMMLLDPANMANQNDSEEIDVFMDYTGFSHNTVRFGKFRPGLTYEGMQNPALLMTIERSAVGTIGGAREVGTAVFGNTKYLDYQIGVYNGENGSTLDTNRRLAGAVRVVARPFAGFTDETHWGKLELEGAAYKGQSGTSSAIRGLRDRERYVLGGRYVYKHLEVIGDWMGYHDATNGNGQGGYITAGYTLSPKWQLVTRFAQNDPDSERGERHLSQEYLAGVNYFPVKNIRLAANWSYLHDEYLNRNHSILKFLMQYSFF